MDAINDEDCVKSIRAFVRSQPDIEINTFIQRGLNGYIYFGKRKKLGDDVVLKFYWSDSPQYDASEEAVVLQKIDHDNILKIYDLRFIEPNYAYFLTPRISEIDLQQTIDSQAISTKMALNITEGLLLGLTELHSKHNLVHRDLKPANILINSNNQPIIADFGAVKRIDDVQRYVTASKATYYYLPPESIQRDEYYFQSDIYQVGVILFQMLGGYFPLSDEMAWMTKREVKTLSGIRNSDRKSELFLEYIGNKINKGVLADTSTLPFYLDPYYKRVLNIALNVNYLKRYANPAFFLKDIHKLLRSTPNYIKEGPNDILIVHDNGRQYRISKNNRQNWVLEKRTEGKDWRKDNTHNGKIESILTIARKS